MLGRGTPRRVYRVYPDDDFLGGEDIDGGHPEDRPEEVLLSEAPSEEAGGSASGEVLFGAPHARAWGGSRGRWGRIALAAAVAMALSALVAHVLRSEFGGSAPAAVHRPAATPSAATSAAASGSGRGLRGCRAQRRPSERRGLVPSPRARPREATAHRVSGSTVTRGQGSAPGLQESPMAAHGPGTPRVSGRVAGSGSTRAQASTGVGPSVEGPIVENHILGASTVEASTVEQATPSDPEFGFER